MLLPVTVDFSFALSDQPVPDALMASDPSTTYPTESAMTVLPGFVVAGAFCPVQLQWPPMPMELMTENVPALVGVMSVTGAGIAGARGAAGAGRILIGPKSLEWTCAVVET